MVREDHINALITGLIFVIAGYLFFINISWLSLNFINKHEIEFQVKSYHFVNAIREFNFRGFLSVLSSPTPHPFLPSLLIAFFKIALSPLNLNEFLTIKIFYFICYLTSLICIYRLTLLYAGGKRMLGGIMALLYAISCPYYYQTLFEGQAPEDLVANTFLFLCLYSYLCYRVSLNQESHTRIRINAALLSLLIACSFFSKYNVGVFIAFSIAVDLLYTHFILKRHSIKRLELFYLATPAFLLIVFWLIFCSGFNQFFFYTSRKLHLGRSIINPFYYFKLLFTQHKPFLHSINGIWEHKIDLNMNYFYNRWQALIALFCILVASIGTIKSCIRKKLQVDQVFIIVPLLYVGINLLFFSFSGYYKPTALISTIPIIWLIAGRQFSMFLSPGKNISTGTVIKNIMRYFLGTITLLFIFACAFLQCSRLNSQVESFMRLNDTKKIERDVDAAVSKIENFAVGNNSTYLLRPMEQDLSFFEEYFSKLLMYRLSLRHGHLLKPGQNVLLVEVSSLTHRKPFLDEAMLEIGSLSNGVLDFSSGGQSYVVHFYSLSPSQFKEGQKHFKNVRRKFKKYRQYGKYSERKALIAGI